MSGTRFARTGRCRFLVCLGILILMVGMVAIFHSSQVQLDETREQRLHCEQQQEALNERLTTLVEQKYHLEKNQERERNEQLESKRNLEQKIKELSEKYQKELAEQQTLFDKLKQSHTLLQSDNKRLKEEFQKSNKQQLDNNNDLERKLQSTRSELQKEKSHIYGELVECQEKHNIIHQENQRLQDLLSTDGQKQNHRILELEQSLKDYQLHCSYKAMDKSHKPVVPEPVLTLGNSTSSERSFKHQNSVSEGVYHISVNITNNNQNKTLSGDGVISEPSNAHIVPKPIKRTPDEEPQQQEKPNRLQVASSKNQVAPLSAPKNKEKLTSIITLRPEQQIQVVSALNATSIRSRSTYKSNISNSPPLAFPPNQRKLPENVAPIPDNFEDLLQKSNNDAFKGNERPSRLQENRNNIFNENKLLQPQKNGMNNINYDSGAHEIKDNVEGGSNIQHEDDMNNFFDNDNDLKDNNKNNNNKNLNDDKYDNGGNDDDDGGLGLGADKNGGGVLGGAAAGDIIVKHNQQLLDDNLKNEIADDQGKEFGDGLRLDEGAIEEDDDDDYSIPSARKQAGGQAIRN